MTFPQFWSAITFRFPIIPGRQFVHGQGGRKVKIHHKFFLLLVMDDNSYIPPPFSYFSLLWSHSTFFIIVPLLIRDFVFHSL